MIDHSTEVQALCDEFSIRVVPKHTYPRVGETRAVAAIRRMILRRGIEHARIVMSTLTETANNKASLEAECMAPRPTSFSPARTFRRRIRKNGFRYGTNVPSVSYRRLPMIFGAVSPCALLWPV